MKVELEAQESKDITPAIDKPCSQTKPAVDEELAEEVAEATPVCPPVPVEGVPDLPCRMKSEPSNLYMMQDKQAQDTPDKKMIRCNTV